MPLLMPDAEQRDVEVGGVVDAAPIGRLQWRVIGLCFLVSMLDGFDTQSIAFVAPSISQAWHLIPSQFGAIFSSTLLGTAIGAVIFGRLADRYGRRVPLSITVALFGVMTLACALAHGLQGLLVCRLLAGMGLGGAIPNFLALASEYAPQRARSKVVVATMWGVPIGAIVGGFVSTRLIASFGWQAVFYAGGILPLLLAPLLLLTLPESIRFLTLRANSNAAVGIILERISPAHAYGPANRYFLREAHLGSVRVIDVFKGQLGIGTVLLGCSFAMSLLLSYLLINWIPLLFRQIGLPITDAVFGAMLLNFGGIAGSYVFSRYIDRSRHALRFMVVSYVIAAVAVASVGLFGSSRLLIMIITGCVGFFLIGTQLSLGAYITAYYPTPVRSTGIGVTQAFGRTGSLLGPLLAGWLLGYGMPARQLFEWGAVPALLTMSGLLALDVIQRRQSGDAEAAIQRDGLAGDIARRVGQEP